MKKFQFRLETALRLQTLQVETERRKLQDLLAQDRRWVQAIEAADEEAFEATRFVQQAESAGGLEYRSLSSFLVGLDIRQRSLRQALATTRAAAEQQTQRLTQAQIDERCLEKLKQRRFAEWSAAAERESERTIEELRRVFDTTSKEDEAALDR